MGATVGSTPTANVQGADMGLRLVQFPKQTKTALPMSGLGSFSKKKNVRFGDAVGDVLIFFCVSVLLYQPEFEPNFGYCLKILELILYLVFGALFN